MAWRPYLVLGLLALMFLALGAHLTLRPRSSIGSSRPVDQRDQGGDAALEAAARSGDPRDAGTPDGTTASGIPDAGPEDASSDALAVEPQPAAGSSNEPLLDRPLRVIGTGWDILAPALRANRGLLSERGSRFIEQGVTVSLTIATGVVEVEGALARGGDHPDGADVAVLPLPTLVAALDDLAPLDPEVFLVTGWSRGQHTLYARGGVELSSLPATGDIRLACQEGTPEHFLATFVLRFAGVRAERIEVVSLGDQAAAEAALIALETPRRVGIGRAENSPPRDAAVVLSTAHAGRTIPYVAIASRRFLREHRAALVVLGLIWLESGDEVEDDVPGTARMLAAFEGAPESLDLMGPISRMASSDLEENARLAGLSGTGPLSIRVLADQVLDIWLSAGLLSGPPVARVEVDSPFISLMVRTGLSTRTTSEHAHGSELPDRRLDADELRPILIVSSASLGSDVDGQIAGMGLIAEVFAPWPLRIPRGNDPARLETIVDAVRDLYDIPEERFPRGAPSVTPSVEVLVPR